MKFVLVFALLSLCIQGFSFTCEDAYSEFITKERKCYRYTFAAGGIDCTKVGSQYKSLSGVVSTAVIFFLIDNYQYSLEEQTFLPSGESVKVGDLEGDHLVHYFKKIFKKSYYQGVAASADLYRHYTARINNSPWASYVKSINQNFSSIYLKYVKILKKYIPWEELQELKEGLKYHEILETLARMNVTSCEEIVKKYAFKATPEDLGRETLKYYFLFKLQDSKNAQN
ncbi:MAG: hypothetical protein H6620_07535 [Halobacteriovoraceae bacterium]|nr:hypothetical protein [Halobacteriovoraceae bacterium]